MGPAPTDTLPAEMYKGLALADYTDMFADIGFKSTPRKHQYASMAWALERDRVAFWHDVGLGKTLTALYTARLWGCKKVFVVCPNSVRWTWQEEAAKHFHQFTYHDYPLPADSTNLLPFGTVILNGTTAERRASFNYSSNYSNELVVINYEGLRHLFGAKKRVPVPRSTGLVYDLEPDLGKDGFDCLILDEMHHLRTGTSIQTRICWELSQSVDKVIGLTGTPLDRDEQELWSEYFAIDQGKSLGTNYYRFLNTHFNKYGFKHVLKSGEQDKILERIAPITIRYDKTECDDLPALTTQVRWLDMSPSQITETDLTTLSVSNLKEAQTLGIRLSRICGGLGARDATLWYTENPKRDALIQMLLHEIRGKVIIFHHFVQEGRLIEAALTKHKLGYVSMRGETKNKQASIESFRNDPKIKCLVAHPRCASEGINVQSATNNIIFYSRDWSGISRNQGIGRIWRTGQERPCLVTDLVMRNSVDTVTYNAILKKQDVAQAILDWMQKK